ncbi:MAG TPA: diacylglycerol kinase family protein [Candidatus Saccharimonadales bacterium]|nr:diacylglycerol kinase family protein [Candidatus Saccharimonadales bacterium]
MKVVLVYNEKSGGAYTLDDLKMFFNSSRIAVIRAIKMDDRLRFHLNPFIRAGETIAVVGGDGTISAIAGLVADTDAVLAPLPGGTLNHFTKDLGIPQDIADAIQNLAYSKVLNVDMATVNDTVFINNSSLGLYPSSVHERSKTEKYLGKWLAAVVAAIKVLVRFRLYRVKINGKTYQTPFVFIGNNRYKLDGMGVSERSKLDDGVLSVFVARTTSRMILFKIALLSLVGKSHLLEEFDEFYASQLMVRTSHRNLRISRDGEVVWARSPLHYKIHAKSLKIRL